MASKTAIVLFNLGGPDRLESVEPFLFNLFNDKAIIGAPQPVRWLIAKWISRRRAPMAQDNYRLMGGFSPLLNNTKAQAAALERMLGSDFRVFIAMRYWHPMSAETVAQVRAWAPERVILLPLYPQYSTTTTGSSLAAWNREAARLGLKAPTHAICCYADTPQFAQAHEAAIRDVAEPLGKPFRLLFSAHGLPEKVVAAGDPYQAQIERSVAAIAGRLGVLAADHAICYQSRVGPLKWIGPSIEAELHRAARDGIGVVVAPIAFVSDHVETLVELDIEYAHLAASLNVPFYVRVPGLNESTAFIGALADVIQHAGQKTMATACTMPCQGHRACPLAA